MPGKKAKTARQIALNVLDRFDTKRHDAGQLLGELIEQTDEKQRATDLVFGAIRNRAVLDMVVTKITEVSIERISKKILNILRIATYELLYSPAAPEYAIVSEAVNQAKSIVARKQAGFVNAALRNISRGIIDRNIPISSADTQNILPRTNGFGCEFKFDLLPDVKTAPSDYLSQVFSLPLWLVKDWLSEFGFERTKSICLASNRRPSIYIRPNTLKTTTKKLAERFQNNRIECEITSETSMIKVKGNRSIPELPGFSEGLFTVQDLTSCLPIKLLNPETGWVIADMCAAPGTKTTQLAELMGDKGEIIATDINSDRLKKVVENCERLGTTIVTTVPYEQFLKNTRQISSCSAILLDVPCSNTGVLARRCEVRLRITKKAVSDLAKTQSKLLQTAASMINADTKICYSTCSIQKQENSEVIKGFLANNSNFKLELEKLTLPRPDHFDCDGGYTAILQKK